MKTDIIETHVDHRGVATIWLNRPEVHNALDDTLIACLTGVLRQLEIDVAVRVVVMAARGRSFSAGADLNWMKQVISGGEALREVQAIAKLLQTLNFLKKPTQDGRSRMRESAG